MSKQLVLSLNFKEALEREDFFVSQSNIDAVKLLGNPDKWSSGVMCLVGPERSGKTHLSLVWAKENNAKYLKSEELADEIKKDLQYNSVCIEDLDLIVQLDKDKMRDLEENILHLLSRIGSKGGRVLFSSKRAPISLELSLKDLESRLQSFSSISLKAPDDKLVLALLLKYFNDRQISVTHTSLEYIATRINRTHKSIYEFVKSLDQKALAVNTKITRTLIDQTFQDGREFYSLQ